MEYRDWEDDEKIREVYYPEVEALVKAKTGAKRVVRKFNPYASTKFMK